LPELRYAILCVDRSIAYARYAHCILCGNMDLQRFHASMERGRLRGYSACFAIPTYRCAPCETASSRSVLTGASYPRSRVGLENGIAFRFKLRCCPLGHIGFPCLFRSFIRKLQARQLGALTRHFRLREALLCRWIQVEKIFCFGPRNFDSIDHRT